MCRCSYVGVVPHPGPQGARAHGPGSNHGLSAPAHGPHALGEPKPVTVEDVHKVHYMIEHCIVRNLCRACTMAELSAVGVDPIFTRIVWQKLQEQNSGFFAALEQRHLTHSPCTSPAHSYVHCDETSNA